MPDQVMRRPNAKEEAMKRMASETMRSARRQMLDRFPLLGHLAMQLTIVPVLDERLPVAGTDGEAVYVNAYVIESPQKVFKKQFRSGELQDKTAAAVAILAHEVWHCALLHFDRCQGKDHALFNIASDIEIGHLLEKAEIPNLSAARCAVATPGMAAEQIYELLATPRPRPRRSEGLWGKIFPFFGKSAPGRNVDGESGSPISPAEADNGAPDQRRNDAIRGKLADGHYASGENAEESDSALPNYGNRGIADPDFAPCLERTEEEAAEVREKWRNAVRKSIPRFGIPGRRSGDLPGNLEELLRCDSNNTLDWKQLLLDYVSQKFGGERQWLPPNRRHVWRNLYLPGRAKETTIELVLAVDTSGSTTAELPDFLAELRGMAAAFGEYTLTVIQCDTQIRAVREYSNDDPPPEKGLHFIGMGGTSLCPPFRYVEETMKKTPTVFIYFTDGEGKAPADAPDYPVIWCLTPGGVKPAEWGMEVRIRAR